MKQYIVCCTYPYDLMMFFHVLLLVTSSLHVAATIDYYVVPDGELSDDSNTHTLNYYLSDTKKYFTANSRLHFKQQEYYLKMILPWSTFIIFQ